MKKSFIIKKRINPDIKVGDYVSVIDGSSFSSVLEPSRALYIVNPYSELTGVGTVIQDIIGHVVEIKIDDAFVQSPLDILYLQDIVVQLGTGLFRVASKHVKKY